MLLKYRCDYVDFDVAVLTNIMKDKVDAFGGITQYLDTQGSLFLKLQDPQRQRAVVNTDGEAPHAHLYAHTLHRQASLASPHKSGASCFQYVASRN